MRCHSLKSVITKILQQYSELSQTFRMGLFAIMINILQHSDCCLTAYTNEQGGGGGGGGGEGSKLRFVCFEFFVS